MKSSMKTKRIFTFFFSILFVLNFAQNQDETKTEKWDYQPNFVVGFDLLNLGISFFGDRKLYQGFISTKVRKNLHLSADLGYDRNIYQKNAYDAKAKGPFVKLGGFTMMAKDYENDFNGFYLGGKVAASFFEQEYHAIPVRGFGGNSSSVALPATNQSAYWLEGVAGGRVQLFETNFYIDANIQPRYLLFHTKQNDVEPMIVPGFGRSSTNFSIGFSWNLAYRF